MGLNQKMKTLIVLLVVLLVCLVAGCFSHAITPVTHDRGCLYIEGECYQECEVGTHSYTSDCNREAFSQRTCTLPVPAVLGKLCDYSRCECDQPTVLNEDTGKCVMLDDCPLQSAPYYY